MGSLLPPPLAGDPRSQAVESLARRFETFDLSPLAVYLIDLVDETALPALAQQFSLLDEPVWNLAQTVGQQRALIKGAIRLHRRKGTPWAVREVVRVLGFGECGLYEGFPPRMDGSWALDGTLIFGDNGASDCYPLDGVLALDGSWELGPGGEWAKYYLVFPDRGISQAEADALRRALGTVAPARCRLHMIDAPPRLDGAWGLDGAYNLGIRVFEYE